MGWTASRIFGFEGTVETHGQSSSEDLRNAAALGNALCAILIVFWIPCVLFYGLMHYTYPRDVQEAKKTRFKSSTAGENDAAYSLLAQ